MQKPDPAQAPSPYADTPDGSTRSSAAEEQPSRSAADILSGLRDELSSARESSRPEPPLRQGDDGDAVWQRAVLRAISEWPLAAEERDGRRLVYLIAGEAFDWRLLAERLVEGAGGPPCDAWHTWIAAPEIFAGLEEAEFMRLLGVDKFRAHLSYFYGVTVEQALLAGDQEEITKRRVAGGRAPSEEARDECYHRLYGDSHEALWQQFALEAGVGPARDGRRHRDEHTLGDEDQFTYWLFKLRMERSDPARVASDTRRGLAQLERMRQAHERRTMWLSGLRRQIAKGDV